MSSNDKEICPKCGKPFFVTEGFICYCCQTNYVLGKVKVKKGIPKCFLMGDGTQYNRPNLDKIRAMLTEPRYSVKELENILFNIHEKNLLGLTRTYDGQKDITGVRMNMSYAMGIEWFIDVLRDKEKVKEILNDSK